MGLKSKDLLGMKQLTADEIMEILDTAKTMKLVISSANKKTSHLQGKSVVTLFYENSTRTRLSFELYTKTHNSICILDAVCNRVSDPDAHVLDAYGHHCLRSVDRYVCSELL